MIIRIPRSFYDDHLDRDLPAPPPVRETKRHVWIETTHPDMEELVNDAEFYADPWGPDEAPQVVAAAKLMLYHIKNQPKE